MVAERPTAAAREPRRGAFVSTGYGRSVTSSDISKGPAPASEAVRKRMSNQGRRDTKPELLLRRAIWALGLRYRVDRPPLKGMRRRADIVFGPSRTAVYVDGCFWHSCPQHATFPKNNREWWREKLEANVRRDRDTDEQLRAAGWNVIRVWEHEDMDAAAERVHEVVRPGCAPTHVGAQPVTSQCR